MSAERAAGPGRADRPRTADEALARAREHGRTAAAEALRALESLLDAASLATGGAPATGHPVLGQIARVLDGLAAELAPGDGAATASMMAAVAAALDVEISRWEKRAHEDPDARAVLRAFLGLRELLWELGVRPAAPGQASDAGRSREPASRRRRHPDEPRVQRVRVEG